MLSNTLTNFNYSFHYSLGETCSHVAAILFKIEAFVRFGLTKTYTADKVQKWNNVFTKSVKAAESAKLHSTVQRLKVG